MDEPFQDRADAGRRLARRLDRYAGQPDVVALALPRGGVPVAAEVARILRVPLEPFLVRKLGVPGHEELAMGAIASGGTRVLNLEVVARAGLSERQLDEVTQRELENLRRREQLYRGGRGERDLAGRTVILIDDGLATGATARAAVQALRGREVTQIIVAVPVAPPQACAGLAPEVEELVCLCSPDPFTAVGLWYRDFSPVSDDQVQSLLGGQSSSGTSRSS